MTKAQLRQAQEALNDEQDKLLVAARRKQCLERDNEDLHRANAALSTELMQGGISDTRKYFEVLPRCGTFTSLCSSFLFKGSYSFFAFLPLTPLQGREKIESKPSGLNGMTAREQCGERQSTLFSGVFIVACLL